MPVHDWTRVSAGTFHDFHNAWIVHLKESLNGGLLPAGFYALSEQHAAQVIPDVLTLHAGNGQSRVAPEGSVAVADAPPRVSLTMTSDEATTYRLARRTLTIRHSSDHQIVALIEIVSPSNKDREQSVRDFVDKAVSALEHGYHLLIVDLFPPGDFDPTGMHGAIWSCLDSHAYDPPAGRTLTLAAYPADRLPSAYVEPIGVGTELPEMPLFLTSDHYVNVPLEPSYMQAFRGVPSIYREVLERRDSPAS